MPVQVAVCGPRHCTGEDKTHADEVGQLLPRLVPSSSTAVAPVSWPPPQR
jgi:hypothetical protein